MIQKEVLQKEMKGKVNVIIVEFAYLLSCRQKHQSGNNSTFLQSTTMEGDITQLSSSPRTTYRSGSKVLRRLAYHS